MTDEPRRIADLLGRGRLGALTQEAERRRKETVRIRELLPSAEAAHVVSATSTEAGELILVMDTPAWAARVRFAIGNLPYSVVRIRVLPRGGGAPRA